MGPLLKFAGSGASQPRSRRGAFRPRRRIAIQTCIWTGAMVEYREAIRINPKYALGHFNLAGVLEEKGKRQEAAQEFAEAARLDPNLNLRRAGSRNRRPPLPPH